MKKQDLWKIYCDKNPAFLDDAAEITFTGRGLKKLFEQTYDIAHDHGVANGKALAKKDNPKPSSSMNDLMKGFGF